MRNNASRAGAAERVIGRRRVRVGLGRGPGVLPAGGACHDIQCMGGSLHELDL